MNDIVDDSRDAGDIDGKNSNEPDEPVVPKPFEFDVDGDPQGSDGYKAEEHSEHGLEGGLVDDLVTGTGVHEIKHFVGSDISVGVGYGPLEFLKIGLLLDIGDEGHFGFGDHQVGDGSEPVDVEDGLGVPSEGHDYEEDGVLVGLSGSLLVVESGHVLVLGLQGIAQLATAASKVDDQVVGARVLHDEFAR